MPLLEWQKYFLNEALKVDDNNQFVYRQILGILARQNGKTHLMRRRILAGLYLFDEELEDVDTIGGFVAKSLGRVPIPGSAILLHGWQITAERPVGRRHRIATFLLEKSATSDEVKEV